ncbi:MAG: DUF1893 domain-containing protein [Clostridia bacterium]|nr:DUF1893 domain-containing protein [Clostridia bacterium]
MTHDLTRAVALLNEQDYTCVLVKGDTVLTSRERGVKPLMAFLAEGVSLVGFSAADKVVGKATALLYALLGAERVYARVASEPAAEVLRTHGIPLEADTVVPAIRNRTNTGFCPMEQATRDITDPKNAPKAIKDALEQLK